MGLVTDAPYHDLCYRIIGAAMDVHNQLGPGLRERHYQRMLMMRLQEMGIQATAEHRLEIVFDD
jgi:GxxExxY protein